MWITYLEVYMKLHELGTWLSIILYIIFWIKYLIIFLQKIINKMQNVVSYNPGWLSFTLFFWTNSPVDGQFTIVHSIAKLKKTKNFKKRRNLNNNPLIYTTGCL